MAAAIPILPANAVLDYEAEGAANIVYSIGFHGVPTPPPSAIEEYAEDEPMPEEVEFDRAATLLIPFKNKLLRVRKDTPTTTPVEICHKNWYRVFRPLFDDQELVQQSLVDLRPHNIIPKLNARLKNLEVPLEQRENPFVEPRPKEREGIYLADDDYGLLVTDMLPGEHGEVREFKPKWLCQSPTAPEDSVRCRQCARVARINAERIRIDEQLKSHFCPLYLISDEDRDLEYAARQLAVHNISSERIFKFLKTTPLLKTLRDWQDRFDKVGVLAGDVADDKFLAAMTLRDCSVFVRFADVYNGEEDGGVVEARLGDLDLKSPKKREYWRNIEEQLISEGWYQGTERGEDRQAPMCWLEYTTRWDSDSE